MKTKKMVVIRFNSKCLKIIIIILTKICLIRGTGLVAEDMCKHGLFRFRNVQIEDSDLEIFGIF